jgi:two-component system alkaline phosphatase synthesis response regulator PhoP
LITARGEEVDRVIGLELGVDDYVCKPFSVRELLSRIKAVLRRSRPENQNNQSSTIIRGPGGLQLDIERRTVDIEENKIDLTRLEFDLLYQLLVNAGRVLTRERLLEQVWGYDFLGDTRAVDSAIKRLRAKLRARSSQAEVIDVVRGVGYRINT